MKYFIANALQLKLNDELNHKRFISKERMENYLSNLLNQKIELKDCTMEEILELDYEFIADFELNNEKYSIEICCLKMRNNGYYITKIYCVEV